MQNFQFSSPTNILFGKGQLSRLPEVLAPFGKRVLLAYGGGSIKRIGLYAKIQTLLQEFQLFELNGIDPNPRIESVEAGVALCRKNHIDVILAVGGGSVIDCAKAIAGAVYYDGDAWEMVERLAQGSNQPVITRAMPICTVLTIAATGSEIDNCSVISNPKQNRKTGFLTPLIVPKCSILEPENTYTVPAAQTAAGAADILSHVLEVYFSRDSGDISNGISETTMKTVIQNAPIALRTPDDYEARANLMWASSMAMTRLCAAGNSPAPWTCHSMEHELSAYYDITHGVGLAILTPRWMRYILRDDTLDKFVDYGVHVWGIDPTLDKKAIANAAIDKTEAFLTSLGIPMTLTAIGIGTEHFEAMAEHSAAAGGLKNAYVPLEKADVLRILEMCL